MFAENVYLFVISCSEWSSRPSRFLLLSALSPCGGCVGQRRENNAPCWLVMVGHIFVCLQTNKFQEEKKKLFESSSSNIVVVLNLCCVIKLDLLLCLLCAKPCYSRIHTHTRTHARRDSGVSINRRWLVNQTVHSL